MNNQSELYNAPRRFMLDNDGSNIFGALDGDWREDIEEAVRECAPNVTTYLVCSGAGTMYFPTRRGIVASRYGALVAAHARGEDPLGAFLRALRSSGKETFITFRMNDVHNPTEEWNIPRVRREHPDCIVGRDEVQQGKATWMSYCMDYSRGEVREYVLGLIGEQMELYGEILDGFQLDWMRFPRHLSGDADEVWRKRGVITEFIAEVRRILHATGRRILLGVRVPSSLARSHRIGLDLAEWSRRGLVDYIVASPFLTTDFAMPIREMRAALGPNPPPIYAAFDFSHGDHQAHCPESLRAAALGLYDSGADGIYLFNFPCWIERLGARPYHWLIGLETPAGAAAKPLLFSVAHREKRHRTGVDLPYELPAFVLPEAWVKLSLQLPKQALPAWRCLVSVASGGDIELMVNGVPAQERTHRRADLFLQFEPRDASKRRRRLPDEDCRLFRVPPEALRAGENIFTVKNCAERELTIERVNLGLW